MMESSDASILKVKKEAAELAERADILHRRLQFVASEDWRLTMDPWLAHEIERTKEALCVPTLPEDETRVLRGQVWTLKRVQALPKTTLQELEEIANKSGPLQRKLERWHNRGVPDVDTALATTASNMKHSKRNGA